MEEIWKDIPGYEGFYQASNLGYVRSLDRYVNHNFGGLSLKRGKILSTHKIVCYGKKRCTVHLCKNGKVKTEALSRMVYSAFFGEIPNGMQVNHIDENPENNLLSNLNLMTPKENSNWGTRNERIAKKRYGIKRKDFALNGNPNAKTVLLIDKNGIIVKKYGSLKEAAMVENCHWTSIYNYIQKKYRSKYSQFGFSFAY